MAKEYLLTFPADLVKVKLMAFIQAMDSAYTSIQQRQPVETPHVLHGLATLVCLQYEKQVIEDKQVTNDIALFRQTFVETFTAAYPLCVQAIQSGAYTIAPGLPVEKRMALHNEYAKQHLADFMV